VTPTPKRLYRLDDLRHLFSCSRSTIYRDIQAGLLNPPVKRGTMSFWTQEDLDLYEQALVNGSR
jgi:predicted DNA-binding transcriptional regulator AlpA